MLEKSVDTTMAFKKHDFQLRGYRFRPKRVPNVENFVHGINSSDELIGERVCVVEVGAKVPSFTTELPSRYDPPRQGHRPTDGRCTVTIYIYLTNGLIHILFHICVSVGVVKQSVVNSVQENRLFN
jgi:hypothetical protein